MLWSLVCCIIVYHIIVEKLEVRLDVSKRVCSPLPPPNNVLGLIVTHSLLWTQDQHYLHVKLCACQIPLQTLFSDHKAQQLNERECAASSKGPEVGDSHDLRVDGSALIYTRQCLDYQATP